MLQDPIVMCNRQGHQQKPVEAICTFKDCKEQRTCCVDCMLKVHQSHFNSIQSLSDLKVKYSKQGESLNQLDSLRKRVTQLLSEIEKAITFVEPKYPKQLSLSNLNQFAENLVRQSVDQGNEFRTSLTQSTQIIESTLNRVLNSIKQEGKWKEEAQSDALREQKKNEVHINIEKLEKLLKYELQQFNLQQFDISRSKDKIAIISEKQIIVWDSNFPNTPCTLVNQSDDNYKSIVFTQDQQKLLVSNDDGELCLFQIKQNESTFKLLSKEKTQLKGRNSIHFYHLQNQFLIGGRENIQLWKFIANENKMKQEQVLNWIKNVYHITISNNDEYIGICSITDNYFIILENLEEYFKIKRQDDDDGFFTLRFYNDSKKFITFSQKLTITIWSLDNKQIQNQYTIQSSFNGTLGYCSMIIEQFDKLLIIYENVNSAILIINLETMKELKKINPKEELKQIELLNDNTIIGMSSQELIQYKI